MFVAYLVYLLQCSYRWTDRQTGRRDFVLYLYGILKNERAQKVLLTKFHGILEAIVKTEFSMDILVSDFHQEWHDKYLEVGAIDY